MAFTAHDLVCGLEKPVYIEHITLRVSISGLKPLARYPIQFVICRAIFHPYSPPKRNWSLHVAIKAYISLTPGGYSSCTSTSVYNFTSTCNRASLWRLFQCSSESKQIKKQLQLVLKLLHTARLRGILHNVVCSDLAYHSY